MALSKFINMVRASKQTHGLTDREVQAILYPTPRLGIDVFPIRPIESIHFDGTEKD